MKLSLKTFYPSKTYQKHKSEINKKYNSLQDLLNEYQKPLHQFVYIPLLSPEKN